MAQVLTYAGENLIAQKAQTQQPLEIDTFIFAYIDGQDATAPIDRGEGVPPVGQQVHTAPVSQYGRINNNTVVYSTVMNSLVGPFNFNWVGLYSSADNVLVAVQHIPTVPKTVTKGGQAGNTLNRNFGIAFSGIAEIANISVPPETWQLDFTARLSGMDELHRKLANDMNGEDWFINDGFLVVPGTTLNTFKVTPGAGYISGLRVEIGEEQILAVQSYPQFIYIDAWFDGTTQSTWEPQLQFTVTTDELDDYIDGNGIAHYLCKIAQVTAADEVTDCRTVNGIYSKTQKLKNYALRKRLFDAVGGIISINYDGGYVGALNAAWDLHKSRGIPADYAIDGDALNNGGTARASLSTIKRVQSEGARFSSHGLNVQALGAGTSEETIKYEVLESVRVLRELGIIVDGFVASQGQFDQTYIKYAEQNVSWLAGEAVAYEGNPETVVFGKDGDLFNIHRVSMATTSVADIKTIIDYCIANDEWIILYDHAPGNAVGPVPPVSVSLSDLTEILDYIISSGIRPLSMMDAISAQFQDAAYGYKQKIVAENVAYLNSRLNDARNLLLDTDFASRMNSISPWEIANTVGGTVTLSNSQSLSEDRMAIYFAGDGIGSGEWLINQDTRNFRRLAFGSGLTFAIDMLGNNLTSGATISLGLRIIDSYDGRVLDSIETTFEYSATRARRMAVSLKNHSELNNNTCFVRAYVRINIVDASQQFTATLINPRLTETANAAEYRPVRDSGIIDRLSTFNVTILPSGVWSQIDIAGDTISELYRISAGRYASPVDATYLVSLSVTANTANLLQVAVVNSSGSILMEGRGDIGASATVAVKLLAGDYFDIQGRQTNGSEVSYSTVNFSVCRIK